MRVKRLASFALALFIGLGLVPLSIETKASAATVTYTFRNSTIPVDADPNDIYIACLEQNINSGYTGISSYGKTKTLPAMVCQHIKTYITAESVGGKRFSMQTDDYTCPICGSDEYIAPAIDDSYTSVSGGGYWGGNVGIGIVGAVVSSIPVDTFVYSWLAPEEAQEKITSGLVDAYITAAKSSIGPRAITYGPLMIYLDSENGDYVGPPTSQLFAYGSNTAKVTSLFNYTYMSNSALVSKAPVAIYTSAPTVTGNQISGTRNPLGNTSAEFVKTVRNEGTPNETETYQYTSASGSWGLEGMLRKGYMLIPWFEPTNGAQWEPQQSCILTCKKCSSTRYGVPYVTSTGSGTYTQSYGRNFRTVHIGSGYSREGYAYKGLILAGDGIAKDRNSIPYAAGYGYYKPYGYYGYGPTPATVNCTVTGITFDGCTISPAIDCPCASTLILLKNCEQTEVPKFN